MQYVLSESYDAKALDWLAKLRTPDYSINYVLQYPKQPSTVPVVAFLLEAEANNLSEQSFSHDTSELTPQQLQLLARTAKALSGIDETSTDPFFVEARAWITSSSILIGVHCLEKIECIWIAKIIEFIIKFRNDHFILDDIIEISHTSTDLQLKQEITLSLFSRIVRVQFKRQFFAPLVGVPTAAGPIGFNITPPSPNPPTTDVLCDIIAANTVEEIAECLTDHGMLPSMQTLICNNFNPIEVANLNLDGFSVGGPLPARIDNLTVGILTVQINGSTQVTSPSNSRLAIPPVEIKYEFYPTFPTDWTVDIVSEAYPVKGQIVSWDRDGSAAKQVSSLLIPPIVVFASNGSSVKYVGSLVNVVNSPRPHIPLVLQGVNVVDQDSTVIQTVEDGDEVQVLSFSGIHGGSASTTYSNSIVGNP